MFQQPARTRSMGELNVSTTRTDEVYGEVDCFVAYTNLDLDLSVSQHQGLEQGDLLCVQAGKLGGSPILESQ